jgi:hypothetical protein
MRMIIRKTILIHLSLFILFQLQVPAQAEFITDSFEDYNAIAEEVIHLHLNKSTYIKGESIGFTAYVLDKHEKLPALMTKNLYVSIEDKDENPITQKLIEVNNGVAHNSFMIDEEFNSGSYLVKAYTNWSRNFSPRNQFTAKIEIIDPKTDEYISYETIEEELDVQFLPESGHLLMGTLNKIGVIIKDQKGYGVAGVSGEVVDDEQNTVSSFTVNDLGIGSFVITPEADRRYTVQLSYRLKEYRKPLDLQKEHTGIVLSTTNKNDELYIAIKTNQNSLKQFQGQVFYLSLHNGNEMELLPFSFNNKTTVNQIIDLKSLPPGVQTITVFNHQKKPLAERLVFNYNGLKKATMALAKQEVQGNSMQITLHTAQLNSKDFNNLSVSVLPQQTKSYRHHHNLLSKVYLQPYIKGTVERAGHYFTAVTPEKKFDMDLLLLTQGWSSYSWNDIFNPNRSLPHAFEQGISIKANINNRKRSKPSFLLHSMNNAEPVIVDIEEGMNSFTIEDLFLKEKDSIYISEIVSKQKIVPAQLFLQSFPSGVPRVKVPSTVLAPKPDYGYTAPLDNVMYSELLDGVQQLDEVVLTTELDRVRARTQELSKNRFGRVKVVSQTDRYAYLTIEQYLQSLGLVVESTPDGMSINRPGRGVYRSPASAGAQRMVTGMAIFFNDVQLFDTSYLYNLPLNEIEFVEVNTTGMGMGFRAPDGYVKIYSLNTSAWANVERETVKAFGMPLSFSETKDFYIPKYQYRNDDFYKGFGTVAWEPNLKVSEQGKVSLSIEQPLVPLTLFVEGISGDGTIISDQISVNTP